jgi:hypothetical protein
MWYFLLIVAIWVLYHIGKNQKSQPKGKAKPSSQSTAARNSTSANRSNNEGDDAFEGWFYDAPGPQRSAAKTVRLKYTDANDTQTERAVNIRAFESVGRTGWHLVTATCAMPREHFALTACVKWSTKTRAKSFQTCKST